MEWIQTLLVVIPAETILVYRLVSFDFDSSCHNCQLKKMPLRQVICLEQSEQIYRRFFNHTYDLAVCRCFLRDVATWNQRRYAFLILTLLSAMTLLQRFKSLFTMWIHSMVRASLE